MLVKKYDYLKIFLLYKDVKNININLASNKSC